MTSETSTGIKRTLSFVVLAILVAGPWCVEPTFAQPSQPIQSLESSVAGVVADLVEAKREDGVLTIRVRFRNASDKDVRLIAVKDRQFDAYYVTAGTKKYLVLRDTEKTPLAPAADGFGYVNASIPKGGSWTWWAKYPAPPADVKKLSYFTPLTPPFDNVPIKD